MNRILIILGSLLIVTQIFSQNEVSNILHGQILDENNEPLIGASLKVINDIKTIVYSDLNGEFDLMVPEGENYKIHIGICICSKHPKDVKILMTSQDIILKLKGCNFKIKSRHPKLFNEEGKIFTKGWLPNFKDTIQIFHNERTIPEGEQYCVVEQRDKRKFDFWCWKGINGLESPTEFKPQLKIRRKGIVVKIKFGNKKYVYHLIKEDRDVYKLIKANYN